MCWDDGEIFNSEEEYCFHPAVYPWHRLVENEGPTGGHRGIELMQGRHPMSTKSLFGIDPVRFFLGALGICLAFGFPRYFERCAFFPWFPNILDSATMAVIGAFLLWDVARRIKG